MEELLGRFISIIENPRLWLSRWKKEMGKKVIGCFPMHIPQEIIHAAGMLPVTLLGSDEPITLADRYVHPYICHSVRGNFDLSLRGELDFLDGVVFPDICVPVLMMSDVWRMHKPDAFYHHVIVPKDVSAIYSRRYLLQEFFRLKAALEQFSDQEISDESLKRSVAIYNHNRILLRRLYELRRANPWLLRAKDIATVVAASMLMPKEEHSLLLSDLLERDQVLPQPSSGNIRLVISGNFCDMPEVDILDLVEESGALVVDDDLYVGRRYFHTLTDESISPMEALAQRYIEDVPCPTKHNPKNDWGNYLLNLVKEAEAKGVLMLAVKYCEPYNYDYPHLMRKLSKESVPHLMIETDHSGATAQIRTRLQAFVETLRG